MDLNITADDAALALDILIRNAFDDIHCEDSKQFSAALQSAQFACETRLNGFIKLLKIETGGNPNEGNEANAEALLTKLAEFEQDQGAFIDALYADDVPGQTTAPQPAPVSALTEAPVAAPAVLPAAAPAYTVDVTPTGTVSFIDRPASTVFGNLGSLYSTELVPTARWSGPAPQIEPRDQHYAFNGDAVKTMAAALRKRLNVFATGDPGCGKTEFFRQFAAAVGLPCHVVQFDGALTRADLIGSFRQVATATGSETPFFLGQIPRLITQPCLLILDEFDQADPDLQYLLHRLLEGYGLVIHEDAGRTILRHEHCYIVATANTKGRGSDTGLTHARFEMSEATRDRFAYWLDFTYLPADQEAATITAKTGLDPAMAKHLVTIASHIRAGYHTSEVSQPCSLRQLLYVAEMSAEYASWGADAALALACEKVIVGRANPQDQAAIRNWIKLTVAIDLETMDR